MKWFTINIRLHLLLEFLRKPYLSFLILYILFIIGIFSFFLNPNTKEENNLNTFQKSFYLLGDSKKGESGKFEWITKSNLSWKEMRTFQTNEEIESFLNSDFFWIRIYLNDVENKEESFLLLEHEGVSFEIYNDRGTLLLKVGDFSFSNLRNKQLESQFSWIKLERFPSPFLYIRVFHPKGQFYKINPVLDLVGSQFYILDRFVRANLVLLSIYFFFLIIGIIAILLSLLYKKEKYYILLDFGLFVLLYGLLGLSTNPFIKFSMSEFRYFYFLSLFSMNFVFIPMLSGLSRIFELRERKILDFLILFNMVLSAFNILTTLFLPIFPELYNPILLSRYITLILQKLNILIPAILSFIVWRKGHKFGLGLFFSFTFTLFCMVIEIYFSVTRRPDFLPLTHWGVLVGVLTQGIALERTIFSNKQKLFLLEKNLQEVKLKNLQEKMNPHFLFNSLNTIHALFEIKPELASEAILRLANNYRFFLDKSDLDWISFEEEWNFLEDYLHLQKLRFFDSLHIQMEKQGNFTDFRIPPLLIQPIIENAFKHGFRISGKRNHELNIYAKTMNDKQIEISIADNGLGFPIEILSNKERLWDRSLGNIKTRLELKLPGSQMKINSSSEGTMILFSLNFP